MRVSRTGLLAAGLNRIFTLQDFLAERLLLDAIVTVVDLKHIEQHLDDEKPEGVENEVCTLLEVMQQHVHLSMSHLDT